MGYCMQQVDSMFTIKAENVEKALEAIKKLTAGYAWVSPDVVNATTLCNAMWAWRWEIVMDNNDVIGISFNGEKLGDDEILFNAIAPYVEAGSFIQMSGEEGMMWRWSFDGKECREQQAVISWE